MTLAAARIDFNPRSREGSDADKFHSAQASAISIHAPAKGATRGWCACKLAIEFQSTLPRRERRGAFENSRSDCDFNPRSREGSDYRDLMKE